MDLVKKDETLGVKGVDMLLFKPNFGTKSWDRRITLKDPSKILMTTDPDGYSLIYT